MHVCLVKGNVQLYNYIANMICDKLNRLWNHDCPAVSVIYSSNYCDEVAL